jgi:NAD(P)H-hydrate epimerase
MRAIDSWAIGQQGVPSLHLMEQAGLGVARVLEELPPDGAVAVVCGKGNNGGDGLVAARLLRDGGRQVSVLCTAAPSDLSADARANLERLPGPDPVFPKDNGKLDLTAIQDADTIVDAMLGIGFQGAPHGGMAQAIKAINDAPAPVLSVDVPSGVDASTGTVSGDAVRADITATFHGAKAGLWINPGKSYSGAVRVLDIGIPRDPPIDAEIGLLTAAILDLLPRRGPGSTKFSSGYVLVVGGSAGLTGAPRMTAQASMRAGAGYVTLLSAASLQPILATAGPAEMMTRGLPEHDGELAGEGVSEVLRAIRPGAALALGPGLGRGPGAVDFVRALAQKAQVAMVLDADGLNAHSAALESLATRTAPTVLTPHPGELGRLLGMDSRQVEDERLGHVRAAALHSGAVIVLKGDDTLIARPDGLVAISPGDVPGLATAGSGDVLTGVIAALLAQQLDAFQAACAGVWLHRQAGRRAQQAQGGPDAVIASDVIAALMLERNARSGG